MEVHAFSKTANILTGLPYKGGKTRGSLFAIFVFDLCRDFVHTAKKIKGIRVKDKEVLLAQFADDTTSFLTIVSSP